jgi:PST family polysaccharide transporter
MSGKIRHNLLTTTSLNLFNYLIPLLVTPYFVRIAGAENFGHITIAQTVVQYFFLFAGYNLDVFGAGEIATYKQDNQKESRLFGEILSARLWLVVFSILLFLPVLFWFYSTGKDPFLLSITFIGLAGYALTPLWYYQGKEDFLKLFMGIAAGKLLFGLVVFLFIRQTTDYWLYNLGISLSHLLTGVLLTVWAIRKNRLHIQLSGLSVTWKFLKEKFGLFRGGTIIQFGLNINITLIGLLLPIREFGIYMAANKLILVSITIVAFPLNQSLYPQISRSLAENFDAAIQKIKTLVVPALFYSVGFLSLFAALLSKIIVLILLGDQFMEATPLFVIMIFSLVANVLTNVLFLQLFVRQNKLKEYTTTNQESVLISILLTAVATFIWGIYGAAISWTLSEFYLAWRSYRGLSKAGVHLISKDSLKIESIRTLLSTIKVGINNK